MKSGAINSIRSNKIETTGGTVNMTPASQLGVFLSGSLNDFAEGDMIGAFDQTGNICGYIQISGKDQNQSITMFGNDRV